MPHIKEPLANYWYQALASPYGIEIVSSDINAARAKLYSIRKEAKDTDLDQIAITTSPFDPNKLWLRRKDVSDGSP